MAVSGDDDDSFCFLPSSERLVGFYLRSKLDGSDLGANAAYFRDTDICSARPEDLVRAHGTPARVSTRDAGDGQQWYFFSPARFVGTSKRRSRAIDGSGEKESWHAEGRPKPVELEGSAGGGYVTKFSYHVRIGANNVEKPGWIMTEYAFKDTTDGDLVLCKIYKSPRGPGRSCKRKAAADELVAPSTRRRKTDDAVFAGEIEHQAAAPEIVQASVNGNMELEDLQNWMMTDVEDDGTTLPDVGYYMGVLLGDMVEQQVQTWRSAEAHLRHASRKWHWYTSSVKSGCKMKPADDLGEATSSRRPRHTNQEEDDAMQCC